MHTFKNSSHSFKFAQHLNEHMHTLSCKDDIMQILYYQKKGPHLNIIECIYTHKEATTDNQLNDKQTIFPSKIFDAILNIKT
jgi:hypothetical protein